MNSAPKTDDLTLPPLVVLYDGVCGLCDKSVQWLLDHDPQGRFHFTPLQGETAAALRARHAEIPETLESMLLVDSRGPVRTVALRSRAVFLTLRELGGVWSWIALLRVFPAFLTDLGYRVVASIRYRVWGELDACRLPSPEERARFLP
ncbi:MAG: DUF393 domain-containing protein [Deltaproteobacteria bacterium]|nr:DUF393 domain-containing protein [Deltaproteobacteria bacterium]